jgi:hypothetical protein
MRNNTFVAPDEVAPTSSHRINTTTVPKLQRLDPTVTASLRPTFS